MSFHKLFMPDGDASPKARAVWRQWQGAGMVGIWFFAWWAIGAFGSVPFLGSGFAKAETMNRVQVQLLSEAILQNRIRHCNATTPDSRAYLYNIIQGQLLEYSSLTGKTYPLPRCEDLAGVK